MWETYVPNIMKTEWHLDKVIAAPQIRRVSRRHCALYKLN